MRIEELAEKMGNDSKNGRQLVWQLFNKVGDPRISTIQKLVNELRGDLKQLI
jgi:hypothetical protein